MPESKNQEHGVGETTNAYVLNLSSSVLYLLPYSAFPAPAEEFSPHIPH